MKSINTKTTHSRPAKEKVHKAAAADFQKETAREEG
jgi:hypothetical protein